MSVYANFAPPGWPCGGDRATICHRMSTLPPNAAESSIFDRVAYVIDRIRPAVQMDGGDIELVEVTPSNVVRVRLHGACVGCPSSSLTLKMGIERNLKEHVPEVASVQAVE